MPVKPADLPDLVEERAQAQKALDRYGALSISYQDWHNAVKRQLALYRGEWGVVWPDNKATFSQPKVPDVIRLAAEGRSRDAAASRPSLVCRPVKPGDDARRAADKRERILNYYWDRNRMMGMIARWAFDSMFSGLTVCQVWPDFAQPREARFPVYSRIDPLYCFPDPAYSSGPFVDSLVVCYEEYVRTIEKSYEKALDGEQLEVLDRNKKGKLIKFFDGEQAIVIAEYTNKTNQKAHKVLVNEKHKLECTPVTIGVRPTADGLYHGEFDNALELVGFANQLRTLFQDWAIRSVYPETIMTPGVDDEEGGPEGRIKLETAQERYEKVQQPNIPFSDLQIMNAAMEDARTSVILPPAVTGNPDESIISAAGISKAAGMYLGAVASLQRDVLKPMLEAANEVAMRADVAYSGDVTKTIYGTGGLRETYNPKKDIGDYYHSEVVYSALSAVDDVNRNVMVLQNHGANLMSRRDAMEQNPLIEDVQRAEKQMLKEKLQDAMTAGLIAQAANGTLDAATLAAIDKALEDDSKSLSDAIAENTNVAPLAQPPGAPAVPATPGNAGAQAPEGPPAPDLAALGLL